MKKGTALCSYQKFIILTMPRSGSNYLSYYLHDHPQIKSIGEVFCIETIWGQPGKTEINHNFLLKHFRNFFPIIFLKTMVFHTYLPQYKAVGFRFFYHQAEHYPTVLQYLLAQDNMKVIHLQRRNLLENLVSFHLAIKKGVWSSFNPPEPKITRLYLSFTDCRHYFESTTTTRKKYDKLFSDHPKLDAYYENLSLTPQKELQKILDFLGIYKRLLNCPLKKQNTHRLEEIITNYRILKKQFINSPWEEYFS